MYERNVPNWRFLFSLSNQNFLPTQLLPEGFPLLSPHRGKVIYASEQDGKTAGVSESIVRRTELPQGGIFTWTFFRSSSTCFGQKILQEILSSIPTRTSLRHFSQLNHIYEFCSDNCRELHLVDPGAVPKNHTANCEQKRKIPSLGSNQPSLCSKYSF